MNSSTTKHDQANYVNDNINNVTVTTAKRLTCQSFSQTASSEFLNPKHDQAWSRQRQIRSEYTKHSPNGKLWILQPENMVRPSTSTTILIKSKHSANAWPPWVCWPGPCRTSRWSWAGVRRGRRCLGTCLASRARWRRGERRGDASTPSATGSPPSQRPWRRCGPPERKDVAPGWARGCVKCVS